MFIWSNTDVVPLELSHNEIFQPAVAVDLAVPLPVNQNVEERLQRIEYRHDVPAEDNDVDRQIEPHRPHENRVNDVRQPANVKHDIDKRELDLKHVVDLPLVVCIFAVSLYQLLINLFAALQVQDRVHDHHDEDRPVVQNVVWHHSKERRSKVVDVVTAESILSEKEI